MATVLTGSGNLTHTNNSGGNQRVRIYWLCAKNDTNNNDHPTYLRFGSVSLQITKNSVRVHYGLHMGYCTASQQYNFISNYAMHGAHGDVDPNGNIKQPPIPLECYLSNGEEFKLECDTSAYILGYNIVVIDE